MIIYFYDYIFYDYIILNEEMKMGLEGGVAIAEWVKRWLCNLEVPGFESWADHKILARATSNHRSRLSENSKSCQRP